RRAEVRRVWPGQLRVRLEEHRAVAFWDGRGDWGEPPLERALLNSHAEVFHANLGEVEDDGLPQLAGPNGTESQVLALWQALSGLSGGDERLAIA
ncbi:MAG: cell division protein FtsQ/DivIB, partial [Roseateles sp.]